MKNVLTLVAASDDKGADCIARAVSVLSRAGATVSRPPRCLAGSRAYDLFFDSLTPQQALEAVRGEFLSKVSHNIEETDHEVDVAAQPQAGRAKRLLVADMESTVIENEMLDELADHVGARERVVEITARAMNGELDFAAALAERVSLLNGLPESVLDTCRGKIRVDPGARALVATLKAHGVHTALVSGGFMAFAEPIAHSLGFDYCQANRLEIRDGRLTGKTEGPVLDRQAKVEALDKLCRQRGLERSDAVTIGDGANDLPMLQAAGLGVAFHGKPMVAQAAPQRIDGGDLSTLLYYLGYSESAISW